MDKWKKAGRKKFNKKLLELSLCGIDFSDGMYKGFNFILNNGDRSEVRCMNQMKEYMIDFPNENIWIRVVQMWYYAALDVYTLQGLKLFDQNGVLLLEVGYCDNRMTEFTMQPDERIIGFRSRKHPEVPGVHCDL